MLIRNALPVMLVMIATSLVEAHDKFITFNAARAQHQRANYRMQDDAKARTFFADGHVSEEAFSFTGKLETLPTTQRDDGSRILHIALSIADRHSEANDSTKRATLSMTLDKNSSFLKLSSIWHEAEDEEQGEQNTMGAFTGVYICPAFVMFPTIMIPAKRVKIGETWELHATNQAAGDEGDSEIETLRGIGRVRSFNDSTVSIEIDYTSTLMDLTVHSEPKLKEKGIGSLVLSYDMQSGMVVNSYSHCATETIGWSFSENDDAIKTIFEHEVTLTLIEPPVRSKSK